MLSYRAALKCSSGNIRATYREMRRLARINQRLRDERLLDQIIFGCAFCIADETGIYNIPPIEVVIKPDGSWEWRRP